MYRYICNIGAFQYPEFKDDEYAHPRICWQWEWGAGVEHSMRQSHSPRHMQPATTHSLVTLKEQYGWDEHRVTLLLRGGGVKQPTTVSLQSPATPSPSFPSPYFSPSPRSASTGSKQHSIDGYFRIACRSRVVAHASGHPTSTFQPTRNESQPSKTEGSVSFTAACM